MRRQSPRQPGTASSVVVDQVVDGRRREEADGEDQDDQDEGGRVTHCGESPSRRASGHAESVAANIAESHIVFNWQPEPAASLEHD